MGLLSGATLWLLAPLMAFVVALYVLKMRRVDVRVSSTMLWRTVTQDMQANHPWQKLRPAWLLALQIGALALLGLAAARPFVRATGLAGQDIAVILDNSASMAATDVRPTRLEWSKERARALMRSLGRGDRMLVIAASERTHALSSLTPDQGALKDAIDSITQTQLPSMMADALALARASQRAERPLKVVVFSDGSYPGVAKQEIEGLDVSFVSVGSKDARLRENTAITMFRVDRAGGTTRAFARISRSGGAAANLTVTLRMNGQLVDARKVRVRSGASTGLSFELPEPSGGLARLDVKPADALDEDNTALAVIGRPRETRVLIVGPGNIFLEQALALDPQIEISKTSVIPARKALAGFDIVIWDRTDATAEVPGAEWFIKADGPGAPAAPGPSRRPDTPVWRSGVEIARWADLAGMRFAGFLALRPAPWARTLAEAGGSSLIAAGEKDGARKISFGWDLMQSDLPLRVSFPILVSNTVSWLLNQNDSSGSYAPGDIVRLAAIDNGAITVIKPDGQEVRLNGKTRDFTQTEAAGEYTWKQGSHKGAFAVNLCSAEQSDLRVAKSKMDNGGTGDSAGIPRTNREQYGYFVIVALAALSVEWLIFHRRI